MSLTEISLNIPTEHVANVFGQFDAYIKKIERTLNVTVVVRGDSMKLIGNERQIRVLLMCLCSFWSCPKGEMSSRSRM